MLDPRVFGVWGQGFGAGGDAGGGGNAFDIDRQITGFAHGADVRLEDGIKLGVAGGYTEGLLGTGGQNQTESATIESGFGAIG